MLIRVIYWHFLDTILGHTPSPFELFEPQVPQGLFGIMSRSSIISATLRHRVQIPYLFDHYPTSSPDPLSFRWLSSIMSESTIFFIALRHRVWISYHFDGSPASCLDPISFWGSLTSCLDPLSFRWFFGIIFGSHIFSVALQHHFSKPLKETVSIGNFSTSCLDPLSFQQLSHIVLGFPIFSMLSSIVFRSPIFSAALQHHVQIPYRFGDSPVSCLDPLSFQGSPASCLNPLSFRWLSEIDYRSHIFSMALRHRVWILYLLEAL